MTRAGSKLVLRTSPAPGHYLCIKWDFASLPLRAAALRISHASPMTNKTIATDAHSNVHCGAGVQRLVAKAQQTAEQLRPALDRRSERSDRRRSELLDWARSRAADIRGLRSPRLSSSK